MFFGGWQKERQHPGENRSAEGILVHAHAWGKALHRNHLLKIQTVCVQACYRWGYLFPAKVFSSFVSFGGRPWNTQSRYASRMKVWDTNIWSEDPRGGWPCLGKPSAWGGLEGPRQLSQEQPSFCGQVRGGGNKDSRFRKPRGKHRDSGVQGSRCQPQFCPLPQLRLWQSTKVCK